MTSCAMRERAPFLLGHVSVLRESSQAILVQSGDILTWIPIVQIHPDSEVKGCFNGKRTGELTVMYRFARQQGWAK